MNKTPRSPRQQRGLSRRMWLSGASATIALPWLPSALSREARAAASAAPKRVLYWFVPNGILAAEATPRTTGADYELTPTLEGLAPIKHRVAPLTGLTNGTSGYTHEDGMVSLLGDAPSGNLTVAEGNTTIDQVIAGEVGSATPFPSLQLSAEANSNFGGVIGTYYNTLSWASPQTPLSNVTSESVMFDRMFAGYDENLTEEQRVVRRELRTSVLDTALERINKLNGALSTEDRSRLDQYATGVRELEQRILKLEEAECTPSERPRDAAEFPGQVDAMADIMTLALQCDMTRVISFMLGVSVSERVYSHLDIATTHHTLSHNQASSDTAKAELIAIQNWQVAQFAALAQKLEAVDSGDGTDLLSNTLMMLCTEFAESNGHDTEPRLFVLAGGEAGGVAQGQHYSFRTTPHANLLLATAAFAGVDATSWANNATATLDLTTFAGG